MPPRAGRWGSAHPGSTSGATGTLRRGGRAGSNWRPRSAGCSPRTAAATAPRGLPRITADLRDQGWRVSANTVAKIMAEQRLVARRRRGRRGGTRPGTGRWRAPDLVGRRFATQRVNRKWYGDGTEIVTDEGKLQLASVLDMGSRRIVGFALGEHHDAELACAALAMAVAVRGGAEAIGGVILHTDRGSGVHRRAGAGGLRPVGRAPIDGPPGIGPGQCGNRVLALHVGVRAAPPGAFRHQGPRPGR